MQIVEQLKSVAFQRRFIRCSLSHRNWPQRGKEWRAGNSTSMSLVPGAKKHGFGGAKLGRLRRRDRETGKQAIWAGGENGSENDQFYWGRIREFLNARKRKYPKAREKMACGSKIGCRDPYQP